MTTPLITRRALGPMALGALSLALLPRIVRAAAGPPPDRAEAIADAEGWINKVTTLKARFLQAAQSGETSEGTLYLSRPGNLRLDYDPPSPIQVIANQGNLVYYDSKLQQVSYVDLDSTLAGVLISSSVRLDQGKLRVVKTGGSPGVSDITVTRRDDPRQGQITLTFTTTPYTLRQWVVLDAQGATTTVSLYDPQLGVAIDPQTFVFNDPRGGQRNQRK